MCVCVCVGLCVHGPSPKAFMSCLGSHPPTSTYENIYIYLCSRSSADANAQGGRDDAGGGGGMRDTIGVAQS